MRRGCAEPNQRTIGAAGLRELTHNRTLIAVAHRLQAVQAADQILVLDYGRIAERGSHLELLEQGDRYATFWQERLRAAGWRVATEHPAGSAENVAAD